VLLSARSVSGHFSKVTVLNIPMPKYKTCLEYEILEQNPVETFRIVILFLLSQQTQVQFWVAHMPFSSEQKQEKAAVSVFYLAKSNLQLLKSCF